MAINPVRKIIDDKNLVKYIDINNTTIKSVNYFVSEYVMVKIKLSSSSSIIGLCNGTDTYPSRTWQQIFL